VTGTRQGRPLTLVRNPGQPVLTELADRGLDALMRQAVAEVRACREVIREAGPDMPGDLRGQFPGGTIGLGDEEYAAAIEAAGNTTPGGAR
jgi:hypothetical protein